MSSAYNFFSLCASSNVNVRRPRREFFFFCCCKIGAPGLRVSPGRPLVSLILPPRLWFYARNTISCGSRPTARRVKLNVCKGGGGGDLKFATTNFPEAVPPPPSYRVFFGPLHHDVLKIYNVRGKKKTVQSSWDEASFRPRRFQKEFGRRVFRAQEIDLSLSFKKKTKHTCIMSKPGSKIVTQCVAAIRLIWNKCFVNPISSRVCCHIVFFFFCFSFIHAKSKCSNIRASRKKKKKKRFLSRKYTKKYTHTHIS